MDDIFSKIKQNDKEEDEGGNPTNNNNRDSMQNDQKKPKGYKSSFKKNIIFQPLS